MTNIAQGAGWRQGRVRAHRPRAKVLTRHRRSSLGIQWVQQQTGARDFDRLEYTFATEGLQRCRAFQPDAAAITTTEVLVRHFENILFVTELGAPAERALYHALKVARTNAAELSIISVVPPLPWEAKRLLRIFSEEELQEKREQAEYEHLTRLREMLRHEGLEVKVRLRAGTPFVEIIREVLLQEHDLLIKAPKATSSDRHTALGSLDLHLVRKCPCPVWIVNPGPRRTFSRILAAVNPHPEEEERNQINSLILDLATSLAHAENSELYIVTARSVYDEATLRLLRAQLSEKQLKEGVENITQARDDMLRRLSGRYELDHIVSNLQVLQGRPGDAISALATRKGVDLVVMGSVEQARQPGVLIGQTAEDILRQVHCSVLTVKPLGFVTPVTLDD